MDLAQEIILVGGALGVVAIVAGLVSARLGTPLLLVFLVIGMLAGEDGPGGILFNDFASAYLFGSLALVVILFEGGLKTSRAMIAAAWLPALALATLGVGITAAVVAAGVVWLSGVGWADALLLGALVAPTDAAAVASVLRGSHLQVPARVEAVLEVESGINDPMAVFLTLLMVEILQTPVAATLPHAAAMFAVEMGGGLALGLLGGWAMAVILRRLRAEPSLLPVLLLSAAMALFGACQMLHASGFLAVYVAGVVAGNRGGERAAGLERAFEAFGWVAQIGLFLLLGLLVTPHDLLPLVPRAAVVALGLIVVARPLACVLCLKPFGFGWGETGFVGWVGLRGAVPIYLAMIPVLEGVANSEVGFAAAFVIVLVSLLVQGWTIGPAARLFGLVQ
jgi:NhaP-type Na+/H+ and K+/H+ antiporter